MKLYKEDRCAFDQENLQGKKKFYFIKEDGVIFVLKQNDQF